MLLSSPTGASRNGLASEGRKFEMTPLEEAPSDLSSFSSSGLGEKVGLRLSFGGDWKAQKDGSFKYVGGETYLEKVPATLRYAELMHRMSEKVNGAVILKYTPPGEDVDPNNLVTCVDDDHVQEMFEEYAKAAKANDTPGKTFRLHVWLFEANEEELTPEDISKNRGMRRNISTPMIDDEDGSSFGSSVSDGTRSPHLLGRRLGYAEQQLNDVEMQEKEAREAAEELHDHPEDGYEDDQFEADYIQEAYNRSDPSHQGDYSQHGEYSQQGRHQDTQNYIGPNWLAVATNCLSRAHDKTYDSSGWPHDRSPFIKGMHKQQVGMGEAPAAGLGNGHATGMADTPRQDLQSRFGEVGNFPQPPEPRKDWIPNASVKDPMQAGTPDVAPIAPRPWTQDSYKEDQGERREGKEIPPMEQAVTGKLDDNRLPRPTIHLPSQLGSDVGNAFRKTTDTQMAEKAEFEDLAYGVAEHILQDHAMDTVHQHQNDPVNGFGQVVHGDGQFYPGFEAADGDTPYGLFRMPSRVMNVTHDSVYRIPKQQIRQVHTIGEGTFGEVILAQNSVFGKIAVKWLKPAKMDKHKAKFWEEARMLAALNHPNVLRFYGVVTEEDSDPTVVGIMTEYMHGSSLSHYLRAGSPRIDLLQRAELAKGAVNGLAYLHQMNIVHFDLKPDNLLLDYNLLPNYPTPGVKVADFGLSKQKFHKYVSGVRDLRGTLPYMAPELVSDPDHVSESADIWSLGMVFWEMLTMETPFQNLTPQEIIHGLMMGHLRPEIPLDCELLWRQILEGCLQTNPSHRYTLPVIGSLLDQIIETPPHQPYHIPSY